MAALSLSSGAVALQRPTTRRQIQAQRLSSSSSAFAAPQPLAASSLSQPAAGACAASGMAHWGRGAVWGAGAGPALAP